MPVTWLKTLSIAIIAVLCAVSFGVIAGVFNPGEKVNALWLVVASACFFILAYRFYGAYLAAKVVSLDDNRITPAYTLNDGKDYHPTNKWVLFGHHFAAIAGAGPLIGPVLAAQFGYLPGFLWLVIGAVLAGGVHDFIILTASCRRNGRSLAQIAKDEVGPVTGLAAAMAIIFIIIIALAGLGLAVVNALYRNPWGTFTIFSTIPIALLMGQYLYKIRIGRVDETSLLGFILLILAVILGRHIPHSFLGPYFNLEKDSIIYSLATYGFIASVLPVWMLLCPRDYLSSFMKIGTVILLAAGVILLAPVIQMPPVTEFIHGGGPIIPGMVFPFVFITIACGAISGFHSLIASGTTPKMIQKESEIKMIGYGAMLVEGFVGVIALIAATILIPGDYFAINTTLSVEQLASMGFPVSRIAELSSLVGVDVVGRPGGAVSLAVGISSILSSLPGMKGLMSYWYQFALLFEALFILTTIDTGTRVARFILQEFGGNLYKPLIRTSWLPGNLATSLLVVLAWAYLIKTGSISSIWPMFGVANQLLGMLALCLGTTILIKMDRVRYIWVTLIPMIFMATITLTASYQLFNGFLKKASLAKDSTEAFNYNLDAALVGIMAGLAIIVVADSAIKWYGFLAAKKPAVSPERAI